MERSNSLFTQNAERLQSICYLITQQPTIHQLPHTVFCPNLQFCYHGLGNQKGSWKRCSVLHAPTVMEYWVWCGILREKIYIYWCWNESCVECPALPWTTNHDDSLVWHTAISSSMVLWEQNVIIHSNCLWLLLGWRKKCDMRAALIGTFVCFKQQGCDFWP